MTYIYNTYFFTKNKMFFYFFKRIFEKTIKIGQKQAKNDKKFKIKVNYSLPAKLKINFC